MRMQLSLLSCPLLLILMQLFLWYIVKKLYKKKQIRYALSILSSLGSVFLIYYFTPFFAMYKDAMPMREALVLVLSSVYVAQMTGFCPLALLHKLYYRRYSKELHPRFYVLVSVVMLLFSVYEIGCATRAKVHQEIVKLKGVKQEQQLLYITDLYAGTTPSSPYNTIKRLAGKCGIVLLGGDLFDESISRKNVEALCTMPSGLYKDVYHAGGNYELLQKWRREYEVTLRSVGVHILQDESVVVNGVRIIGRRDREEERRSQSSLMKEYQGNEPAILLEHRPESVEGSLDAQSLQLSGHTHNGQIFPNTVLTRIPYPRAYGNCDVGYRMLISSGVSTWGFLMRVASHNEVLFIAIRLKQYMQDTKKENAISVSFTGI